MLHILHIYKRSRTPKLRRPPVVGAAAPLQIRLASPPPSLVLQFIVARHVRLEGLAHLDQRHGDAVVGVSIEG